jgi:hypothetical protein
MNLLTRFSYANVTATLALFLAIAGGTVYAASEIGKNDVKSKNIAKGAVKTSDLHSNAVTGEKLKDGTISGADLQDGSVGGADVQDGGITGADIAAGVIPQITADVTGSATGGPQGSVNTATISPLPLSGKTTFTANDNEVVALAAEAQFTIATTNAANPCQPGVFLSVDGGETRLFIDPITGTNSTTLVQSHGYDADGPFGLLSPGTEHTITAQLRGDVDCTATSKLDTLKVSVVQIL